MESTGGRRARTGLALLGLIGMVVALSPAPARAAEEPWDSGRQWVSVRAGYAKSNARFAPGGSFAYGFAYSWFLGRNVAWSASAGYDVLGKYGGAAEIEAPFTTEFTKHFRLGPAARPYLGLGWGAIYHKVYRTGADESGFRQGIYFVSGANAVLSAGSLIGLDFRVMLEQDARTINPVFPNRNASSRVMSLKLGYTRVL